MLGLGIEPAISGIQDDAPTNEPHRPGLVGFLGVASGQDVKRRPARSCVGPSSRNPSKTGEQEHWKIAQAKLGCGWFDLAV